MRSSQGMTKPCRAGWLAWDTRSKTRALLVVYLCENLRAYAVRSCEASVLVGPCGVLDKRAQKSTGRKFEDMDFPRADSRTSQQFHRPVEEATQTDDGLGCIQRYVVESEVRATDFRAKTDDRILSARHARSWIQLQRLLSILTELS